MSEFENEKLSEQETAGQTSEEPADITNATSEAAEAVTEAAEAGSLAEAIAEPAPKKKAAVHMTASAAALNADGEVDIRRMKPREVKEIKQSKISYERKKSLYGYGFIAIWIVGIIYMFIIPMGQSLWYALCKTELVNDAARQAELGMSGPGIYTEWNNFDNIKWAFTINPDYPKNLASSLGETAYKVPLILVFSLFVALLLNDKFKGRTLARAIFFLPVLIATGPVLGVINGDMLSQGISEASQFSALFKTDFVEDFLMFMGLNNISQTLADTVSDVTSSMLNLIWDSGIQILIFISALQTIPVSAKEAASMEGATGWEFFWKITFPTISPMILVNLVYTTIDAFIKSDNPVMKQVMTYIKQWEYDHASAMAWIYFAIIGLILAAITGIVSRFIFYQVD